MIPSIEDILADLMDGSITREKAIAWIEAHLRLTEETASESMRDGFAAAAMQGLLAYPGSEAAGNWQNNSTPGDVYTQAYVYADAMIEARAK
jgi:hypothetical protein